MNLKKMIEEMELPPVSKEDLEMSLEGITTVEKWFLNIVRIFRSESWLRDRVIEEVHEITSFFQDKAIDNISLQVLSDMMKSGEVTESNMFETFEELKENVPDDIAENEFRHEAKYVIRQVFGDLAELDESEFKKLEEKTLDKEE